MNALEQQREDAALGAAWRRCEAALPEGWTVLTLNRSSWPEQFNDRQPYHVWAYGSVLLAWTGGATPTTALLALAEALEARKGAAG